MAQDPSHEKAKHEGSARRATITKAWWASSDARSFTIALESEGYCLARSDSQAYVVVNLAGEIHSLTRQIEGVKAKDIRARLANLPPEYLLDAQTAQERVRHREANHFPQTKKSRPANLGLAFVPYALLVLAVLLAYANVYHNEFVYDDLLLITENKYLTSWHYFETLFVTSALRGSGYDDSFYRPLVLLLYLVIYQAVGPSTVAFHLLNVGLHAVNSCLLYTLGLRLRFNRHSSFVAVLLWSLHPVHTETITYMSGTTGLLCGTFLLAGTLALVPAFSRGRILTACALFTLGLLSKEIAVVFPVLTMSLLFYLSDHRWSLRTYLKTWPFWLIAGLFLVARATVLNFNFYIGNVTPAAASMTIAERVYTFLATLPVYLRLIVWPTGLHMDRSFLIYTSLWTPQVLGGLLILTALFAGFIWKPAKRATPLAWGILWAAALHAPVSGLFFWANQPIAERWLYLPTMGLSLGFMETLAQRLPRPRAGDFRAAGGITVLLTSCLLGLTTREQNKVWRDSFTFYNHFLESGEDSSNAHIGLGLAYERKGQYELAIAEFRQALALSDDMVAHYDLGRALLQLDCGGATVTERTQHFRHVLELHPDYYLESMKHFQRALELDPNYFWTYDRLAEIYFYTGNYAAALQAHAKSGEIQKKLEGY